MPVLVMASSKGGAGKSTASVVLGCELARTGARVVLIDADPNRPLSAWAVRPGKPETLEVRSAVTEETIIEEIEEAATQVPFVVVDLEGTASLMVAYAVSRADLVLIPTQGSQLDAAEAAKAIRLIRQQEKAFTRRIPHAVLLTRTSAAIKPRTLTHIRQEFVRHGVPVLPCQLHEREAFRAIFSFGGSLQTLDPANVSNLPAAIENAAAFSEEVVRRLRQGGKQEAGAL